MNPRHSFSSRTAASQQEDSSRTEPGQNQDSSRTASGQLEENNRFGLSVGYPFSDFQDFRFKTANCITDKQGSLPVNGVQGLHASSTGSVVPDSSKTGRGQQPDTFSFSELKN